MTQDELDGLIKERIAEMTKHWTTEDHDLINAAMKGIYQRQTTDAVYHARRWAFLEARASTVKMETEEERRKWFDEQISHLDYLIKGDYGKKS